MYKYSDGDDQIEVLNDTINLVLSRDIRKNVKIGANIAFNVARENPDLDVWYVNTYAGIAMLKESFTKALERSGMPVPIAPAERTAVESIAGLDSVPAADTGRIRVTFLEAVDLLKATGKGWMVYPDGRCILYGQDVTEEEMAWARSIELTDQNDEDDENDDEENEGEDDEDAWAESGPSVLPNLFIHDVPIGTWNTLALGGDIRARGRKENHAVVVLNSFEFAPVSRAQKEKMVTELITLREQFGLTFIVFSHKMNWDIEAGLPGRGPLGVLASKSGVVIRLKDPFEHMIHSRRGEIGAEKGIVHETQMRSAKMKPKTPSERDGVARLSEYEDYHVDPWLGSNKKSGGILSVLARTPLLKQYYNDHRHFLFTRGLEPTEYLLDKGEYEPMEEKMEEALVN